MKTHHKKRYKTLKSVNIYSCFCRLSVNKLFLSHAPTCGEGINFDNRKSQKESCQESISLFQR